jgi:catechol 2,3-dioxygenase-like lactoylglutathione lyase family enzyme
MVTPRHAEGEGVASVEQGTRAETLAWFYAETQPCVTILRGAGPRLPVRGCGEGISMLSDAMAVTTIPVTDLEAARRFYGDALGLRLLEETPFSLRFAAGRGTQISTFKRGPIERSATVCHFEVTDIDATVSELRGRGVVFEEYADGPLKTTNGIAQLGPARGAWFKDPDGNFIGLREGSIPG